MHKPLLLLLAAGGLATAGHAQSGFRPGYVVTLSGDTLRGEIDDRGAERNARLARFRRAAAAAPDEYRPAQLRAYGFAKGHSFDARYPVDSASTQVATGFYEVLERGSAASLYYLAGPDNRVFYLGRPSGPVVLLEKRVEKATLNAGELNQKTVTREVNLYRAKLSEQFADCPDMGLYIAQLPFGETPLRQAVRRYNACKGGVTTAAAAPKVRPAALGLTVGGAVSQLTLKTTGNRSDKDNSSTWVAGLSANLPLSRRLEKISLLLGALYQQDSYVVETQTSGFSGLIRRQYRFNAKYVRVPLGLRFTFGRGAVQPFLQGGWSNSFAVQLSGELRDQQGSTAAQLTAPRAVDGADRRHEQGVFIGLGLKTNSASRRDLSFTLQGENSNGFSKSGGPAESGLQRFYALLTYDLTK